MKLSKTINSNFENIKKLIIIGYNKDLENNYNIPIDIINDDYMICVLNKKYDKVKINDILKNSNEEINDILLKLNNIEELIINNINITINFSNNLINLKHLELNNCKNICDIPDTYINIESLTINKCPKLNYNVIYKFKNLTDIEGDCFDNVY